MISVSRFAARKAALLCFLLCALARGEGVPFKISAPIPQTTDMQTFLKELKHQAVVNWLKEDMKDQFSSIESKLTPELTEEYILDFRRRRFSLGRPHLEVSGHLNADGLRSWARLAAVKASGSGMEISPLFLFSSDFPGHQSPPQETASAVKTSLFAQTLLSLVSESLQKLHVVLRVMDVSRLGVTVPARNAAEVRALREIGLATESRSAVWFHLMPCDSCGGARLDTYFYNFEQSRIALADTTDLALVQSDIASAAKLKTVLAPAIADFQRKFEALISKDALFSSVFRLLVRGVDYTNYRDIEGSVGKLDFVRQILLKSVQDEGVEFEVMSPLTPSEFSKRLAQSSLKGFRLQVLKIDSNGVVVQYFKSAS